MSRLRADKLVNRVGTGAPQLTYGAELPVGYGITGAGDINISGTVTATSVSVSGGVIPGINTAGTSDFTDVQVGGALTVTSNLRVDGDFQVNGTTTTIDTVTLVVEDKNIGIGTTSTPSNSTADGGGLTIFGGEDGDKTLQWLNSTDRWTFGGGAVQATAFYGDGSQLDNVVSGVTLKADDSLVVGGAATTINFSGATISEVSSGIATITISGGGGGGSISTEALTPSGTTAFLDLTNAQDHKVTATGNVTISASGGTEGESHTVRIVNSGTANIGFSTYFLFPSGSSPSLPTASGSISLLSFTVHRVGAGGTQLLAGASLNFN